jgi:predicted kinase
VTPAEAALAWVLGLSPAVVAIPGARRPETARSAASAAHVTLGAGARSSLDDAFAAHAPRPRAAGRPGAEVVVVMGIPGAGKSRVAHAYVERGYVRLNRDERGGTLRGLARALDEELSRGARRVVLDNTYLTRASRRDVLDVGARHGATARCVWLDTPLAQAQVNLVARTLDRLDRLPSPEELKELARREPGLLSPTSQMRALRELEPPADDEGFRSVEVVPFDRAPAPIGTGAAVFVAAAAFREPGWRLAVERVDPAAPHLVFDWLPDGEVGALAEAAGALAAVVSGPVGTGACTHGGGPPACWCRPPLPGLPLAFGRAHAADPARSTLIGMSTAHRTLAATLGARYVAVGAGG